MRSLSDEITALEKLRARIREMRDSLRKSNIIPNAVETKIDGKRQLVQALLDRKIGEKNELLRGARERLSNDLGFADLDDGLDTVRRLSERDLTSYCELFEALRELKP